MGDDLVRTYRDSKQRGELEEIAKAKPEQSQAYTVAEGADLDAAAKAGADIGIRYKEDGSFDSYTVTPKPVEGQSEPAPQRIVGMRGFTEFLGQRREGTITPGQVNAEKLAASAGVLEKNGDPLGGLRLRAASDSTLENERKHSDEQALRQALRGSPPPAGAGPRDQTPPTNTIGTGPDIIGASNVLGLEQPGGQAPVVGMRGTQQPQQAQPGQQQQSQQQDFDSYLKNAGPGVLKALVQQGKLDQAKQFQSFIESNQGKAYTNAWTNGVRRLSIGDTKGALGVFEKMYNGQLFDDGHTVKMAPVDGKPDSYSIEMIDPQGKSLGARVAPIGDIAKTAAMYLEPSRAVEFMAQQQGKREAEDATHSRQVELETMRQDGRALADDRREERLVTKIQASQDALEQRLTARGTGDKPLTAAQQRANIEIDAAREITQGLDPADIRKRTQKTTDTGRENPDYDPGLARATSLAARRKIGEDQDFDSRQRGPGQQPAAAQQPAPAFDRQDVAKRFRADPNMNVNKLGKDTPKGVEVLDSKGKLIGYFR